MDEYRLDTELEGLYKKFPYLWKEYDFQIKYVTRDYGVYYRGFIVGLESNICKIVFEKESNSPVEPIRDNVGTLSASFTPPAYSYFAGYGWYSLSDLIYWLSGVEYVAGKDVEKDLENLSEYLKLHMDKLLDLFRYPDEFEQKLAYYRNLYKGNQLTVEKIRAERARLHALGMDSSLDAAITNLRGGKNEQPRN
jgi:hypothetical protein